MKLEWYQLLSLTGWRPGDDCCTAVLHWLWSWYDEWPSAVSHSNIYPRQLPCVVQVHALLGLQDPAVLHKGLFCTESHCAAKGEGGHCQLCSIQVAAVVLAVLRGIQVCWAKSSQEWRHHCRELDRSVCCWWPGISPPRAVIPRDYCRLQQQVSTQSLSAFPIQKPDYQKILRLRFS